MKKYYVVCDYRGKENCNTLYDDHYSKSSIDVIVKEIQKLGYECTYLGGIKELIELYNKKQYDRNSIYLNFNDGIKTNSKRGQTPIILELMGVKYSGSSPLTHLIVSNKFFTNIFLQGKIKNLIIPKSVLYRDKIPLNLNFPLIIKPNEEGSSLGINDNSICHNIVELEKQLYDIKQYNSIIIQEFINGYELTNYFIRNKQGVIIFNELLVLSKGDSPIMNNKVFTANDKLNHLRKYYNPNKFFSNKVINDIKKITNEIADYLDIITIGRIDYKYFNKKLYFIEANTIPAFSKTSEIGEICKIFNYSFSNILGLLLDSIN